MARCPTPSTTVPDTLEPFPPLPNPKRAYIKMACVAAVLGVALGALITFVDRETFHDLRHHLTLLLIIAIVVIVNITSFLLFVLFWGVYRWIKRDFDPDAED